MSWTDELRRREDACRRAPSAHNTQPWRLRYAADDVRYLPAREATAVSAADTLSIIPSIAGGLAVQAIAPSRKKL